MNSLWICGHEGLFGMGESTRIELGAGPARFEEASRRASDAFSEGAEVVFASFTFDPDAGGSILLVPDKVRRGPLKPSAMGVPRIRYAGTSASEVAWLEAVDAAVKRIEAGEFAKVVLARDILVWAKAPLDAEVLAARLAGEFPTCYTFLVDGLVGATPELLVRRSGSSVESLVLAGTVGRGESPERDAGLGESLFASPKEVAEHRLAVESVTDALRGICEQIHVEPRPTLLKLANVQHLATRVRARLLEPLTALEVAGRLHPTAAVCGSPRGAALDAIRTLEGMDRGRYGGPVGWMDARGDGEFGIALRCAEVEGNRARLFAGAGIVAGSLPEAELEETRLKLRAMQSALEG